MKLVDECVLDEYIVYFICSVWEVRPVPPQSYRFLELEVSTVQVLEYSVLRTNVESAWSVARASRERTRLGNCE